MCLDEGTLQAYLDKQLDTEKTWAAEAHLASCSHCRQLLARLRETDAAVGAVLSGYRQEVARIVPPTERAWENFRPPRETALIRRDDRRSGTIPQSNQKGVWWMLVRYRTAAAVAAAALFLTAFLSFGPTRSVAAGFLNVFRMEKARVITFNPGDMADFERSLREAGLDNLDDYAKMQVSGQQPSREMSPEQARQAVEFPLMLPPSLSGRPLEQVYVQPGARVSVTPDVQKINSVLQVMGSRQFLPDSLNGKTFEIKVPSIVSAEYWNREDKTPVLRLVQAAAPEISVPEGVDAMQIREVLLQLPFLPDDLRRQLAAVEDWWRTMPIPNVDGETREVDVNGAPGVLISPHADSERIILIWQQDGVWLALEGQITLAEGREIARQLR
ncbi:hypothetical protein SY88_04625 [Clostridiales bacterium PH28_bin88]|nr:hypothetical protein SY88_04625 [Clostridiales bacterium PH28_bin88]